MNMIFLTLGQLNLMRPLENGELDGFVAYPFSLLESQGDGNLLWDGRGMLHKALSTPKPESWS